LQLQHLCLQKQQQLLHNKQESSELQLKVQQVTNELVEDLEELVLVSLVLDF
jgi:hypothetical protein